MIDKTKPFYIVRTPNFGNGEAYSGNANAAPRPGNFVDELWRATQSRDEAIAKALAASVGGKVFNVFELRMIGTTSPPLAQWQPVRKPRKAKRKAKRKVRK
jgi:hypothetical protein